MSRKRLIWQEISDLAERLQQQEGVGSTDLRQLGQQMGKLGKVQFKANTLLEAQLGQQKETLETLQATIARQEELIKDLGQDHQKEIESARHNLVMAILPMVDGIEAALANGRQQVSRMPNGNETRSTLIAWLEGVYLVYRRALDLLVQVNVEAIPAVGRPFDPRLHVVTGVDSSGKVEADMIVLEERRGYRTPEGVLRYADVVVSRPSSSSPK